MEPHPNNRPPTHKNPKPNKDLLRLEDRIFGLIDDHPVEPKEKAVKKMLTEKPKPQIGEFKESARNCLITQSSSKSRTSCP